MIISAFAYQLNSRNKVFRSSCPMSSMIINYYITEFINLDLENEGIIEKEKYNYIYVMNNLFVYALQATKDYSFRNAMNLVKYIERSSSDDLMDILITIDNVLYNGIGIFQDLGQIKSMDSQDEKIHKMMMENKRQQMIQKEKEAKKTVEMYIERPKPVYEQKPRESENYKDSVLIIIKEKIKLILDKDNVIKDNVLSGEMDLIITNPDYRHLKIKTKNLKQNLKFSPYLDKDSLKKNILRFEESRGLNKVIPLMKWKDKVSTIPLKFEFWNDEDGEKTVNIIEITAIEGLKNLELRFECENMENVEVDQKADVEDDYITWRVGNFSKGDSKTIEIKGVSFEKNAIFPISLKFNSSSIQSSIDIESVFLEDDTVVNDYVLRKVVEVEDYKIVSE